MKCCYDSNKDCTGNTECSRECFKNNTEEDIDVDNK